MHGQQNIKIYGTELMKKSQAGKDEDFIFLMSLHITYNKQTENKKSVCSYKSGQTCRINPLVPELFF